MATTIVSARPAALDRPLRRRRRFLRTFLFFLGIIIHVFFFDILGNRTPLIRWYAQRSALRRWAKVARDFRALAVVQGGVLIKLGQFLSSRADILPASITDELAGLQDEVPPAPWDVMRPALARELGRPPEEVFASFDTHAVAAASIGQVYFAQLHDGRAAAVKLQRPQIAEIIEVDLSAVSAAVQIIKNYPLIKRRADLPALLQEFARVLRQELDYELEAQNALEFRANFAEVAGVYVPEPYCEHSTKQLLVMERIGGVKIHDYPALEAAGIDRAELAERFNKAYQKQFFLDGLFHADPHPGNLFVRPEATPAPGVTTPYTLIFIDLGMVGRISPALMRALREGIIGVATNDAVKMVEALDMGGIIRPGADRGQIVRAIQIVLRHTYDRSIRELSNMDVENVFADVEHLVRDLPFQLPQDLIYLGRAVALVSGITTGLYPDVNLFALTRPFAQELIARQQRELNLAERVRQELGALGQAALALPKEMDAFYKAANRGDMQVQVDFGRLERGMRGLERAAAGVAAGVVASGLFVGGAILRVNGFAADAWWAWGAAALVALWAIRPRRPGR